MVTKVRRKIAKYASQALATAARPEVECWSYVVQIVCWRNFLPIFFAALHSSYANAIKVVHGADTLIVLTFWCERMIKTALLW